MKEESKLSYPLRCEICGAPPEPEEHQPHKKYTRYKEQCKCGGRIRLELWNPQTVKEI